MKGMAVGEACTFEQYYENLICNEQQKESFGVSAL